MFCTIGHVSFYSTKIMAEEVPVTQDATVDETQTVEHTGRQQTDVETNNASVSETDTQNQLEDKGRVATNSVSVETTGPTTSDKVIICLDPGHGGSDSGAISVVGTYEKNLNLKIAE